MAEREAQGGHSLALKGLEPYALSSFGFTPMTKAISLKSPPSCTTEAVEVIFFG
jgi:hypothetical protein